MDRRRRPARAAGFTLVELLVAMTLGLVLVSGVVAVFTSNKRSADLNQAMADLQEAARFALAAIGRDLRMSGFQGCLDVNTESATIRASGAPSADLDLTSTSGSVVTASDDWTPDPLPGFTEPAVNAAVVGTHTLQLQYGSARTAALAARMTKDGAPSASGPLVLESDIGLAVGDLAIVANCDVGDLFAVTAVSADGLTIEHGATANSSGSLTRAYGDVETIGQTRVMGFSSNVYYVGDTGRSSSAGDAIHALYRQSYPYTAENPPLELVDGVEDMRVAFGIRLADGALRYVTADDALYDPGDVESVKVGLLMSSSEALAGEDDAKTYVLAGHEIVASDEAGVSNRHPKDKRLRLAFNTTVKIRNRRDDS